MFMRPRITKIGENTVAHIFGDVAAILLDQSRAGAMIGADDPPQVLGIELCRESGRANEVAEHDCKLPALRLARSHIRCGRSLG
jgi:hypothetical protein